MKPAARLGGETVGLFSGEAVGGVTVGARLDEPLGQQDSPGGGEDTADLPQPGSRVVPVVDGADSPRGGHGSIGQWERFGAPDTPIQTVDTSSGADPSGEAQHDRGRVDADDRGAPPGGQTGRGPRPTADVQHPVSG